MAAGATVIALGSYVDTNNAEVVKAITEAVGHDVVVVVGAPLSSVPVAQGTDLGDGVLRVGGIGLDGQGVANYRSGGSDVVAPGVNVAARGITGAGTTARSGTQYAVAYVAGAAALVRAACPGLSAQQVAHRVEATAQKMGSGAQPNAEYGYGLIDPAASVTKVLPEEAGKPAGLASSTGLGKATGGRTGRCTPNRRLDIDDRFAWIF